MIVISKYSLLPSVTGSPALWRHIPNAHGLSSRLSPVDLAFGGMLLEGEEEVKISRPYALLLIQDPQFP